MAGPRHDAIVLVGGRARRLGGRDKAGLVVAGRPLLERALEAARDAERTVVAGVLPPATVLPAGGDGSGTVQHVVEQPPRSGPVAGISAGLAALAGEGAPWVLVLAVDQPGAAGATPALLERAAAAAESVDGLCPTDSRGRPQWLLAAYRADRLRAALADLGDPAGAPVRRLVERLRLVEVAGLEAHLGDVDTPEQLARWQVRGRPPR